MSLFRWRPGRRNSGYSKMLLAGGRTWDCWLLRYPVGSEVPLHHDPIPGRRHYRLNITLLGRALKCHRNPLTIFAGALARQPAVGQFG